MVLEERQRLQKQSIVVTLKGPHYRWLLSYSGMCHPDLVDILLVAMLEMRDLASR